MVNEMQQGSVPAPSANDSQNPQSAKIQDGDKGTDKGSETVQDKLPKERTYTQDEWTKQQSTYETKFRDQKKETDTFKGRITELEGNETSLKQQIAEFDSAISELQLEPDAAKLAAILKKHIEKYAKGIADNKADRDELEKRYKEVEGYKNDMNKMELKNYAREVAKSSSLPVEELEGLSSKEEINDYVVRNIGKVKVSTVPETKDQQQDKKSERPDVSTAGNVDSEANRWKALGKGNVPVTNDDVALMERLLRGG